MDVLVWIILATVIDSLVALVGAFSLGISDKTLSKIIFILVSFSTGALLSGGLLHLTAESLEKLSVFNSFLLLIVGFSFFFLMEKFLYWHHCHKGKCEVHPYTTLILFGDGIHNFIDGLIIGVSFLVSVNFGLITTLMIITHEIPQELGDFGVLVYGGLKKKKAILYNFLSQVTCILGGILGYFFSSIPEFIYPVLPFAAGGFIYISASDLIPELHKEIEVKRSVLSFAFFLAGIALMVGVKLLFGG